MSDPSLSKVAVRLNQIGRMGDQDPIAKRLDTDPDGALEEAATLAEQRIPGHLGECVAVILLDHVGDKYPDFNIHELAYTLLAGIT